MFQLVGQWNLAHFPSAIHVDWTFDPKLYFSPSFQLLLSAKEML
jgi:hypothetical protein